MRKLLFLLGLIAFILVAIYCVYNHRLTIQDDVQNRVAQSLTSVNSGTITASTSGRDVTLTGNVDTESEKQKIASQVLNVEGVRTIINNLTVTPIQSALTPTPEFADFNEDLNDNGDFGLDTPPTMGGNKDLDGTTDLTATTTPQKKSAANVRCEKDIAQIMEGQIIKFSTGSAKIDASSMNLIKKISNAAENCPSAEAIIVHGHTDNVGNAQSNMDLSVKRAVSVGQQLKLAGVKQRVDGVGHGDLTPIASNDNAQGRAQNRRIEFEIK